ncbi:MAG: helix-turn-helix transcriptional regulator [Mediterraneibacter gnavus]
MEIGVKLKEARIKSGLTQENVAEKIQVSRQTISNWENEKSFRIL